MASVLLVRPGRRFRLSRFKGNYIIRDLTRLRNSIKNARCLELVRAWQVSVTDRPRGSAVSAPPLPDWRPVRRRRLRLPECPELALFEPPAMSDSSPQCAAKADIAIRAYAVTDDKRVASAPDIPSVDKAGLPGFYMTL
jgi:hypothetical protein